MSKQDLLSNIKLSSVGIGTYLGNEDVETDDAVVSAICSMVQYGCNVIDTAPNYRNERAEKSVGIALQRVIKGGYIKREELFVSSKVGIMPPCIAKSIMIGEPPFALKDVSIDSEGFCFDPIYIEWQVKRSLNHLLIDSLDCLYLHNIEVLRAQVGQKSFLDMIVLIVPVLECLVATGLIRSYGIASWNAFRVLPDDPEHIDLFQLFQHLDKVGVNYEHFKCIQLPIGVWGTEAVTVKSQGISSAEPDSILAYALKLGIAVFSNSSLLQGDLLKSNLSDIPGPIFLSPAQRAINFTRSITGVRSIIVGIKSQHSINEALEVLNSNYIDLFEVL